MSYIEEFNHTCLTASNELLQTVQLLNNIYDSKVISLYVNNNTTNNIFIRLLKSRIGKQINRIVMRDNDLINNLDLKSSIISLEVINCNSMERLYFAEEIEVVLFDACINLKYLSFEYGFLSLILVNQTVEYLKAARIDVLILDNANILVHNYAMKVEELSLINYSEPILFISIYNLKALIIDGKLPIINKPHILYGLEELTLKNICDTIDMSLFADAYKLKKIRIINCRNIFNMKAINHINPIIAID